MNIDHQTTVRIGTSGIVLPGAKASFPAEFQSGSRLHYYGSLFNTLEINSSFYKIPMPSTFEKWADEVPESFRFTVKLWRGITHAKKLLYALDDIDFFMRAANQLREKKGCLLIQFPASISIAYLKEVEKILLRLEQLNEDGKWQFAIEFRHTNWYQEIIYTMLNKFNVSLVFHDMPTSITPTDYSAAPVIYYRFHGPTGNYKGSYTNEFLQDHTTHIKQWCQQGKTVYVYFNNTIEGALYNAQTLQKLCLKA